MADALGTKLPLSLLELGAERTKKRKGCLPFSWREDSTWGGDPLYAAAEAELLANFELGAGNERERPGDCFAGGLSAISRVAKAWMEG